MSAPPSISEQTPHADRVRWFTEEVQPYDSQLKAHLRGTFPALRDVDDVVQESYLRLWRTRATQPIRSAKGLLFTVARRLALNLLRHERRSPMVEATDIDSLLVPSSTQNAADAATRAQELDLLVEAVESLPARCREVFVLRRLQGVPQKDIASRLGLSEQTVQVQAARGLRKVEKYIQARLSSPS